MNLKLVVASMSILGLVSCPVFAATHAKKHHHMKKHHRMMKHQKNEVAYHDYKDMGSLPIQPAPVACTISQANMVLAMSSQNLGRMANPCNPGWFNRIQFSGGINVDVGKWGRTTAFMGENYQRLSLNDAHLDVTATVNDWTKAFASISYNTATINDPIIAVLGEHVAEYSAAYDNNANGGANHTLQLEQAYVTLGNVDQMPVYVQVGKQFQDFSRYPLHPITRSMTQVMSETLATSAKIGFVANGFNGSLAVFDNPTPKIGQTKRPTDYVASLGFGQAGDQMGWDLGIGYMYDLNGVNDVAYNTTQFNLANAAIAARGFNRRTSGVALYGDVNSGPFMVGARWTTATSRFNVNDLPKNGIADIVAATGAPLADATGARPWAAGITAGFVFDPIFGCHKNNIYVGYQASREAAGLNLPRSRWLAGYEFDYWKSTKFGIEWDRDIAYSVARGGTGNNSNLVSLRAGVEFG